MWKAREGAARRQAGLDEIMQRVEAEGTSSFGARLVGISESVKSEQSLREAVDRRANVAVRPEDVIASTYDLNRYTFTVPTAQFSAGVREKYRQLRNEGFEPIPGTHTDRFDDPAYKGMNTAWRHKAAGYPVEVQFHTPESFQANRDSHPIYEAQQQRGGAGPRDGVDGADYRQAGRHLQAPYYAGVPIPDRQALYDDENIPLERRAEPLRPVSEAALQQVSEDAETVRERIRQERQLSEQEPVRDTVLAGDGAGRSPPSESTGPEVKETPSVPDPRRALDDRVAEGMARQERQPTQDPRSRAARTRDADREPE